MADVVVNEELGRLAEQIGAGGEDLIVVPLSAMDIDDDLKNAYAGGSFLDDFLGDAANTEQTGSTWTRKVHLNAAITLTVDDAANDVTVQIDVDDTWASVAASNDVVGLLICIDGASDAVRQVVGKWDFAVTTDGNDVTADYSAVNGIWQSS